MNNNTSQKNTCTVARSKFVFASLRKVAGYSWFAELHESK